MTHSPVRERRIWAAWGILIGYSLIGGGAKAAPPNMLKTKTYHSAAGGYSLTVVPSHMFGRHGASYQMTKEDEKVWAAQLPVTLWDAAVTETGVVAGYGYTLGFEGIGSPNEPTHGSSGSRADLRRGIPGARTRKNERVDSAGNFVVVIIDPRGKVRMSEATERVPSRFLHAPPDPAGVGLFLDPSNDRVVVRVADPDVNRHSESWWVYRLSTGAPLEKIEPKKLMPDAEPARFIIAAAPVAGTELTLVHWWRIDGASIGARFTLVDLQGKPIWLLEWKDDYVIAGDRKAEDELMNVIRRRGAILDASRANLFDVYSAAKSKRITFAVKKDASKGWVVSETAQVPFALFPEITD